MIVRKFARRAYRGFAHGHPVVGSECRHTARRVSYERRLGQVGLDWVLGDKDCKWGLLHTGVIGHRVLVALGWIVDSLRRAFDATQQAFPPDGYARGFGLSGSPSGVQSGALLDRADEAHVVPGDLPRHAAYARAGWYMLDHGDLLLAVREGQPLKVRGARPRSSVARASGKSVLLVRAGNRQPGTDEPTGCGPEQDRVLVQRMPAGS